MTLRAITVRQPWAWAIVHGGKGVENRTRNIAGEFRGLVAVHAALTWAGDEYVLATEYPTLHEAMLRGPRTANHWTALRALMDAERGHVIAVADLVDVHHADRNAMECAAAGGTDTWCSLWAEPGAWHLVLHNPRPLASPVPARGFLGLWTLPDDVEARVREQLETANNTHTQPGRR